MKKILSAVLLVLMTLSLASCWGKKKFEDLALAEQQKIEADIQKNVLEPYIQDIMSTAMQSAEMTEDEFNNLMTQKWEALKTDLIKYLETTYPKIDFNIEEIANIDMTFPPAGMDNVDTDDLNNIVDDVENIERVWEDELNKVENEVDKLEEEMK